MLIFLAQLNEKLDQSIYTLPLLEQAQAQDPDNPRVNFSIGLLQSGAKRYPEAIEALKRAVALDQTNDRYYFNLGAAYERLGDFDNAVTAMRKAIELNPQGANALNYLGYMYADRGRIYRAGKESADD